MELSPFPYQGPLEPAQVHGRDEVIADLIERVTARRVTALLGPRRYGKTSVLRRLANDLSEVTTVWVDLYEVSSLADVAVRFDAGLGKTTGTFGQLARRLAVGLSLNLGLVSLQLTGLPRNRPDPLLLLQSLLDVLVSTAERVPTLLVIDEFSSIARVPGAAGALRTAVQHHFQELGLVFAGSHPSMMRTLFSDRAEPFYGQADLRELGPLTPTAIELIVTAGFAETGREAGRLGGLISGFAGGHPQRSMQLADASWRLTPPRGRGDEQWASGLAEVQRGTFEGLERLYSRFNASERAVLRAVAQSGTIYGSEADLLDLSTGAATHARRALLDGGDLLDTGDTLQLVDPLFADWIRRRFPI